MCVLLLLFTLCGPRMKKAGVREPPELGSGPEDPAVPDVSVSGLG